MSVRDELVMRCALRRREKIGGLSDQGFQELLLAVGQRPEDFVDSPEEAALLEVGRALDAYATSLREDDVRDDDEYQQERRRRLAALNAACGHALQTDPDCTDAQVIAAIAAEPGQDQLLSQLMGILRDGGDRLAVPGDNGKKGGPAGSGAKESGAWADVFARPALRLRFAIANACLASQRYRLCTKTCLELLDIMPADELGAGKTCAIAYARLEDEAGFDALDERQGRVGNTWTHLSRAILLYKLDRMPAARRALRGYGSLCEGAAYALLRPVYVEPYLPDRPTVRQASYEEAMLCIHEAEAVLTDVPDFFEWAAQLPGFQDAAQAFADEQGLDW